MDVRLPFVHADLRDPKELLSNYVPFSFPTLRPYFHGKRENIPFQLGRASSSGDIHTTCTYQSCHALLDSGGGERRNQTLDKMAATPQEQASLV